MSIIERLTTEMHRAEANGQEIEFISAALAVAISAETRIVTSYPTDKRSYASRRIVARTLFALCSTETAKKFLPFGEFIDQNKVKRVLLDIDD